MIKILHFFPLHSIIYAYLFYVEIEILTFCLMCPPDEEGVRYVPVRPRPQFTLLRHYRNPWKAAYHHFQRYTDIRVKG